MASELQGVLKKSGQVTLDAAGNGVLTFDPDHANQRWEIKSVVVTTNQPATAAVVPFVTVAKNTVSASTMSPGNQFGTTWNGNNATLTGFVDVGAADFFSVLFTPPAGASGAPLAGVIATAVIAGLKYTRRG